VIRTRRFWYAILFVLLLAAETAIALFVRDAFVRPYVGDALVTLLIGCFCRTLSPGKPRLLPLYVFLFAAAVELLQLFDLVALPGLQDNALLSTLIGRTFSPADLVCYAVGCTALFALDRLLSSRLSHP